MSPARCDATKADGVRAVCQPSESLPDLCHHSEYRIYVDGQYVESTGSLGSYAMHVLEFYQRRRKEKAVEVRAVPCRVPNCERGQS